MADQSTFAGTGTLGGSSKLGGPGTLTDAPLLAPIARAWHFRELIGAVVRRELAVRFRGSILGWLWAIFGPLIMLVAYTLIFSSALGVPRSAQHGGVKTYAFSIFAGMIVFNLFSEIAARAPGLLHEHANFIKKSIFPCETLAWTATIRALVYAGISVVVLLAFLIVFTMSIPVTILFLPFIIIPFALFLLGTSWFLMALGSFTRDVSHLMASILPVLMFATPVFYTMNDVPAKARIFFRLNIVGDYVELFRDTVVNGVMPDMTVYALTTLASLLVFHFGFSFFMRYRSVFVDVL